MNTDPVILMSNDPGLRAVLEEDGYILTGVATGSSFGPSLLTLDLEGRRVIVKLSGGMRPEVAVRQLSKMTPKPWSLRGEDSEDGVRVVITHNEAPVATPKPIIVHAQPAVHAKPIEAKVEHPKVEAKSTPAKKTEVKKPAAKKTETKEAAAPKAAKTAAKKAPTAKKPAAKKAPAKKR
jgi:hypothetical protein